ncbi:MAG: hypothetical protein H6Q56_364 [Deltaproteobacteria bacterium]|nr:hypothetical protein [Deltaproteobacteria bacterium]
MIQHPAVIALGGAALTTAAMTLYAGAYGLRIHRRWDLTSGSEQQLVLERKTYLISVIMAYTLAFQILALFLFIQTTDSIHNLFTGAMCAAGSLAANGYGYPLLLLKIGNCVIAGTWLISNHLDSKGYDYPLIKPKYLLLALIALLFTAEAVLQTLYFTGLQADVITSCCGSLFGGARESITGDIATLPPKLMIAVFTSAFLLYLASGVYSLVQSRGWLVFAALSLGLFLVAGVALISFISLYFYELPTHHCPFCILQKEYGHVGYILYGCLLGGVICGTGCGVAELSRGHASLGEIIPAVQKRAAIAAMLMNCGFAAIAVTRILTTSFRL